MKSRRQAGGGGGVACAAVDGNTSSGGGKMERKDVEKNRRLHMKGLCLKLSALVPATSTHHIRHYQNSNTSSPSNINKDAITQLDQLDSAAAYIKQLKARIDELKRRKQGGCSAGSSGNNKGASTTTTSAGTTAAASLPVIEVRHQEATLDVALVSEAGKPFKLHEVIAVLEQEGAEVVSASFSVVGDKIFYTLHSQALCPRIGLEADRVSQRLHGLAAATSASAAAAVGYTA